MLWPLVSCSLRPHLPRRWHRLPCRRRDRHPRPRPWLPARTARRACLKRRVRLNSVSRRRLATISTSCSSLVSATSSSIGYPSAVPCESDTSRVATASPSSSSCPAPNTTSSSPEASSSHTSGRDSVSVCVGSFCVSGSDTAFLLDLEGGAKMSLAPHMMVGAGLDLPIAFHSGQTTAFINLIGRFIYTF